MLRPQIRQQIPMHCFFRSVLHKPLPLALRPWWSVKYIFFYQAALIELGPEFTKRLYCGVFMVRDSLSDGKGETDNESQTILKIEFPGLFDQPFRSAVRIMHRNPRESLCDTGFEPVLP
jgi:hypothetical protein